MYLQQVTLSNFRNYIQQEFELQPSGNLIIGPNGCGKTNLLEAIAYCGTGKSIRFHRDDELMHYAADQFGIRARFMLDLGMDYQFQINYSQGRKLLKLDQQPIRQLSKLYDSIKVIYCAPEDLHLIGGSPRFRRQYFDLAISQLFPEYITILRQYLHVVNQRNVMLKGEFCIAEKSAWDKRFVDGMRAVFGYRQRYLGLVNQCFAERYSLISDKAKDIRVDYLPIYRDVYSRSEDEVLAFVSQLQKRELRMQRTLIGPHLDDYEFTHENRGLRVFGSQGQKRIVVIVLKLIQAHLIEEITRIRPILLFDDIFAELDNRHSIRIRELTESRYQVFIASPKADIAAIWGDLTRLEYFGEEA